MLLFMVIFSALLFYLLSPGILLSLPKTGSLQMKAAVHALVFAVVFGLTHKTVWAYFNA